LTHLATCDGGEDMTLQKAAIPAMVAMATGLAFI
jgi:hypothetical protein